MNPAIVDTNVVDTNVVVSGLVTPMTSAATSRIVRAMLGARFEYIVSAPLLAEYRNALTRPHVRIKHTLTDAGIEAFLADIANRARQIVPGESRHHAPDPGDQHLWAILATLPEAILVTGDKALLASDHFPGRILSPRQFVERDLA